MITPWVISSSGYSVKEDRDDGTVVLEFNYSHPLDGEAFTRWLGMAEYICGLHNDRVKDFVKVDA